MASPLLDGVAEHPLDNHSRTLRRSFKWTDEEIKTLIRLRHGTKEYFTGKRNTAQAGWEYVLREMNLEGVVSVKKTKKKWDNLVQKYRELRNARLNMDDGPDDATTNVDRESWPYYAEMDQAIGGSAMASSSVVSLPVVIASIMSEGEHGVEHYEDGDNADIGGDVVDFVEDQGMEQHVVIKLGDADEADESGKCSPPRKRRRRIRDVPTADDDVYVQLLKQSRNDWLKMHETCERQGEQMIALFADLVSTIKSQI